MNIYVGNLAYQVTDDDLRTAFEAFGDVASARIIIDRETGRSKGFGFVEMPDRQAAMKAIETLNGKDIGGRAATVNEAQPRPARPASGERSGYERSDRGERSGGERSNLGERSGGERTYRGERSGGERSERVVGEKNDRISGERVERNDRGGGDRGGRGGGGRRGGF